MTNECRLKFLILFFVVLSLCACNTEVYQDPELSNLQSAAEINTQLALNYINDEQYQLADEKLMLAMKESPSLASARSTMGLLLEKSGDPVGANRFYKRAISLAPKEGSLINNYAEFLCRQGEYEKGLMYFSKVYRRRSYLEVADAYQGAAECSVAQGNFAKATELFQMALSKSPERIELWLRLSELNYELQNYELASTQLTHYLSIAPPNHRAVTLGLNVSKELHNQNMSNHYASLLTPSPRGAS